MFGHVMFLSVFAEIRTSMKWFRGKLCLNEEG